MAAALLVIVAVGVFGGSFEKSSNPKSNRLSGPSGLELHLREHLRREGVLADRRLQGAAASHQRDRGFLARLRILHEERRRHLAHLIERQRLRVVVVQMQPEDAGAQIGPFEMMPGVGRHEEHAAVLRVVVAVRARRVLLDHRRAVGAGARRGGHHRRLVLAAPRHRRGHLDERCAVNGTLARLRLDDEQRPRRTRPHRIEPNRHQLHAALAALAGIAFDHVFVARHRADVRERRQLDVSARRRGLRARLLRRASSPRRARSPSEARRVSWTSIDMLYTHGCVRQRRLGPLLTR